MMFAKSQLQTEASDSAASPHITSSSENYLKQIYLMNKDFGFVRSVDLACFFGYAKSTICVAVKDLSAKKLIYLDEDKCIHLTERGRKIALDVYGKYMVIYRYLTDCLGVSDEAAKKEACRMEHIVSDETCMCLVNGMVKGETAFSA